MKASQILKLVLKEGRDMWLKQISKYNLNERETQLAESSFNSGWNCRGIYEEREREDDDAKPIAWYMADKNGKRVSWGKTIFVDPKPYECYEHWTSNADKVEPENAPHSWLPLKGYK